jgi:hypothetical protein
VSKFIFDHTKKRAIRISHISVIEVTGGKVDFESSPLKQLWNVSVTMKNKQKYILKTGLESEAVALKWMKGLGFIK